MLYTEAIGTAVETPNGVEKISGNEAKTAIGGAVGGEGGVEGGAGGEGGVGGGDGGGDDGGGDGWKARIEMVNIEKCNAETTALLACTSGISTCTGRSGAESGTDKALLERRIESTPQPGP